MPKSGWGQLLAGAPWFQDDGKFPIAAYSEFIPPPRLGIKPYSKKASLEPMSQDPYGWQVTEYEEAFEFRPGFQHLAGQWVTAFEHLGSGRPAHGIARGKLTDNPYWPPELADRAERFRTNITWCSCRWLSRELRTIRVGCAGRFLAGVNKAPARPFGKRSSPRRGERCRKTRDPVSFADS